MNRARTKLFAIYKNGIHLGNQSGKTKEDAIKLYIIASNMEEFINDKIFVIQYSAEFAVNGVHHHFINDDNYLFS